MPTQMYVTSTQLYTCTSYVTMNTEITYYLDFTRYNDVTFLHISLYFVFQP